jgi:hypothetical protein
MVAVSQKSRLALLLGSRGDLSELVGFGGVALSCIERMLLHCNQRGFNIGILLRSMRALRMIN